MAASSSGGKFRAPSGPFLLVDLLTRARDMQKMTWVCEKLEELPPLEDSSRGRPRGYRLYFRYIKSTKDKKPTMYQATFCTRREGLDHLFKLQLLFLQKELDNEYKEASQRRALRSDGDPLCESEKVLDLYGRIAIMKKKLQHLRAAKVLTDWGRRYIKMKAKKWRASIERRREELRVEKADKMRQVYAAKAEKRWAEEAMESLERATSMAIALKKNNIIPLLKDKEVGHKLSTYQTTLITKQAVVLARFYFLMGQSPSRITRYRIAQELQDIYSFGPTPTIMASTIISWERQFREYGYRFVPSRKGRFLRSFILAEEEYKLKALDWLRSRTDAKGRPNVRVKDFLEWVNDLEGGLFKGLNKSPVGVIGWSCARSWLHKLGFKYRRIHGKGYFDGHEAAPNVQYREALLQRTAERQLHTPLYIHMTIEEAIRARVSAEDIRQHTIRRFYCHLPSTSGEVLTTRFGVRMEVQLPWDQFDWLWEGRQPEVRVMTLRERAALIRLQRVVRRYWRCAPPRHQSSWVASIIPVHQDEMICRQNMGQDYAWTKDIKQIARLRKKGEGRGVMISGFINDTEGFLTVNKDQLRRVNARRGRGKEIARMHTMGDGTTYSFCLFHYGKNQEGYWTGEDMVGQTGEYIDLWEEKHGSPDGGGPRLLFFYDWSSGHQKMPETAWNIKEMNLNPGGGGATGQKVKKMSPTIRLRRDYPIPIPPPCVSQERRDEWVSTDGSEYLEPRRAARYPNFKRGDYQHLFFQEGEYPFWLNPQTISPAVIASYLGKPKGLKQLLWGRGLWRHGMSLDGIRVVRGKPQAKHPDLSARDVMGGEPDITSQKSALQLSIEKRGHYCDFLPKYHCELNPIELVWGKCKRHVREYGNDNYERMCKLVPEGLLAPNIPLHFIHEWYRRTRDYMAVYGLTNERGEKLCPTTASYGKALMDMKEAYKSHRRPPPADCDLGEDGKPKPKSRPWDLKKAMKQAAEARKERERIEEEREAEVEVDWDDEEREVIEVEEDHGYVAPAGDKDVYFEEVEDIREVDFDQILAEIDEDD